MDKQNAIEVRNVNKDFKIEYDKAKTLKERLLFLGRGNAEYHHVLKNININIKLMPIIFMIEIDASSFLSIKIIFPPFDDILIIHVLYYFVKFFVFVLPISVSLGKS